MDRGTDGCSDRLSGGMGGIGVLIGRVVTVERILCRTRTRLAVLSVRTVL